MAIEMRGITKAFGDTVANNSIDFSVRTGEIHVLLGENGAGKTTLMNILFGHMRPDAGVNIVPDLSFSVDAIEKAVARRAAEFHMPIQPDATVEVLPIDLQQRVEI